MCPESLLDRPVADIECGMRAHEPDLHVIGLVFVQYGCDLVSVDHGINCSPISYYVLLCAVVRGEINLRDARNYGTVLHILGNHNFADIRHFLLQPIQNPFPHRRNPDRTSAA